MLDLTVDGHVHTAFAAGRDSVSILVAAAEQIGLTEVVFCDEAGPETRWLPSYLASIQRARRRTEVVLRAGIEVEAIGTDGWLAFPADLGGLDMVSVAVGALPMSSGLAGPEAVRGLLDAGALAPADVVEMLVTVSSRAIERVSRYAPTRLARPLAFLQRAGLGDTDLDSAALGELTAMCRRTNTQVEISERHQAPSKRLARLFAADGVRLVAASDARRADEVGRWRHVEQVSGDLAPVGG
ncbi:hydrolase [Planosporangium thailandense]|uniref:Hydrolase n=1 Tax=Planosporangium thailandense TaxID=765197 RepID=A0ABX0XZ80_9ACTN|nr:hydrolase [Planosporangium thailandense]NJC71126.1 hydrolase [Planosporangium thailandense]